MTPKFTLMVEREGWLTAKFHAHSEYATLAEAVRVGKSLPGVTWRVEQVWAAGRNLDASIAAPARKKATA